jgi:hypothetical protein
MASAMEKDCGIWENFYSRDFFSFVLADALSRDGGQAAGVSLTNSMILRQRAG